MRIVSVVAVLLIGAIVLADAQGLPSNYKVQFENAWVRVTNTCDGDDTSVDSTTATIHVICAEPEITASPRDVSITDGQSTQFTAATDRVTGEVVRVEVTINVAK